MMKCYRYKNIKTNQEIEQEDVLYYICDELYLDIDKLKQKNNILYQDFIVNVAKELEKWFFNNGWIKYEYDE